MSILKNISFAVVVLAFSAIRANAVTINYPDQTGTDVVYTAISEDTRSQPNALFGAPTVSGNTLDFDPLSFAAETTSTTGTSASTIVDGQLNFTVMSNNDSFSIPQVIISEAGDYTLAGLGAAQATASVAAPVLYSITHVNGNPLSTPINGSDSLMFSPSSGSYSLPANVGTEGWSGSLTVDVAAIAAANNLNGAVTKIEFVMDNVLSVAAADGGSATIAKKDSGVTVMIPEPSSFVLLGMSVMIAVGLLRRKP